MTAILGISAFYHDSAAALVVDGEIIAAAQEERFIRVKHDSSFPKQAIEYCLREAGLQPSDLDYVTFYEKPLAKFDRILETFVTYAPLGFGPFREAIPAWLKEKLNVRRRIRAELGRSRSKPVVFLDHHESHAASAFFPSPFEEAAILTLDGVGEWSTTTLGHGQGNTIRLTHHLKFPHSLGLLYSAFTAYCGFEVNDGEYKLMGLAPYGQPVYADTIYKNLIDLKSDGSFRLNMGYFSFGYARRMTNRRFERLFGGPPRRPESALDQRHADIAASIQAVLTEAVLRIASELHRRTNQEKLVLAGGVALNCVANERLLRDGPFKRIWIQPAAGDAGGALGSALFVWHQLLGKPRTRCPGDSQRGSLLGPRFSSSEVREFLDAQQVEYQQFSDTAELNRRVARALADGKVVGWLQGRMEFGPRALGARSILADARRPEMQSVLNQKIKFREGFRPFAPAVLAEHSSQWFKVPHEQESPYMLLTAPVAESQRCAVSPTEREIMVSDPDFCRRAAVVRSTVPGVTHTDLSARIQTVDAQRNPGFHALLAEFFRLTGCPAVINTSFNVRGEPIVCTPEDAYRCFEGTYMDVLILEDCLIENSSEHARIFPASNPRRYIKRESPPTTRQLREFAVIGSIIVALLAIRELATGDITVGVDLGIAAVIVGVVGWLRPRWLAPLFSTWMLVISPVAWLISTLLLAIVFYGLVTPLGLFFRLIGRDPLDRSFGNDQDSYWQEKPTAENSRRYLQQF